MASSSGALPGLRVASRSNPSTPASANRRGGVEDDPRPQHVLVGAVAIGDDRLETSTIFTGDQGADILSHPPSM